MPYIHHRACNLCEAICGLEIHLESGAITSIRGDEQDPFSRGHICPKAVALQDIHADPDRLRRPVRRVGRDWHEISWDEALDEVAARLSTIRRLNGPDSIGFFLGNPAVHSLGIMLYGPFLYRALRTRHRYSATSLDQLPHHVVSSLMFGHQFLIPIPDLDRTSYLLVLGANPAVSNGSMMTAPDVRKRLKAIRGRGGRIVVVDPRRTETARLADEHVFIRPGTDAFFLFALLHTVFQEKLESPGVLATHCLGLERVRDLASSFSADDVAAETGVKAEEIRRLAREMAQAPAAVCYGRLGVSVQEFGALCQWLISVLNVVTGNLDRPGGAMFTRPAVDLLSHLSPGRFGRWMSSVRGLPEFGGELSAATLAEDILAGRKDRVRALFTIAGNPVLSAPNGRLLEKALDGLEFQVALDFYVNETTRHADIILPPTGALERDHYDLAFHALAIRNTARFSPALFSPGPGQRHDWQIVLGLLQRLEAKGVKSAARRWWLSRLGPTGLLDLALRRGPYGSGFLPGARGLNLRRLRDSPHGVDLGPLASCLPERLRTEGKKIDLAPEALTADVDRLRARLEELGEVTFARKSELLLIGRRHVRSNNSWMHNFPRLMKGRDRCTLLMHPDDAADRGLADLASVVVISRVGEVQVPLEISDEMMPGVVSLPHGWGHGREGVRLETAARHPGISMNDLTDHGTVDTLCGTAVLTGVPIRVVAAPGTKLGTETASDGQ